MPEQTAKSKSDPDNYSRNARLAVGLLLVITVVILVTALSIFKELKKQDVAEAENYLEAVVDLKAREIEAWLNERKGDAEVLRDDAFLAAAVETWLMQAGGDEQAALIHQRLESIRQAYHYRDVLLLDKDGSILLSAKGRALPSASDLRYLHEAFNTRQIVIADLHREQHKAGKPIEYDIIVPITSAAKNQNRMIAALYIYVDVNRFLFPRIQSWPFPSNSGETLLVRREGDSVVFMNDLRFRHDTAFKLRFPVDQSNLPAAMVMRGFTGVIQGQDYRGINVLAAVRKIHGTDWALISKVDIEEIFEPIRRHTRNMLWLVSLFMLGTFLVFFIWRRGIKASHASARQNAELQQQALKKHFDYLTRYANDIILLTNDEGMILEANDRASEIYQYAKDELLGKDILKLEAQGNTQDKQRILSTSYNGLIFETTHLKKDRSSFPVEVSLRNIRVEDNHYRQLIIRDITERRRAEELLQESEEKLRVITDSASDAIIMLDNQGSIIFWSKSAGKMFGYKKQEVADRPMHELIIPERLRKDHINAYKRFGETGQGQVVGKKLELSVLRKDGTEFDAEIGISTVKLHDRWHAVCLIRDITERKQAEEALQESEERWQFALEGNRDGVWDWNVLTNEVFFSKRWKEMLGYEEGEIGNNLDEWDKRVHPDDKEQVHADVNRHIDRETPFYENEYRVLCKDGSYKWILSRAKVLSWTGDHRPQRMIGTHTDITERKQAEERETGLGKILQRSLNELYIFDDETLKFILLNRGALENLGYSMEEVSKLTPVDIKPEFNIESFERLIEPLRNAKQELIKFITVHRRKDGSLYPVEVHLQLMSYQLRPAFVASILDITERSQEEEKLLLSEQRLRLHREQIPLGTIEWNTDFECVDWNPAAQKIFGYTKEEVLGRHITDVILPESSTLEVDKEWSQLLSKTGGEHNINENCTKDGKIILCEWFNTALVDEDGKVIGVTSTVEDITHKMEIEEQLRRAQKMESIGQLSGGIAHDFNNLLTIIQGNLEILKRTIGADQQQQKWLEKALNGVRRGTALTNKMLSFSRSKSITSGVYSVNAILAEMEDLLHKSLTPKIMIKMQLAEDVWLTDVNEDDFQDALVNLVLNARDAMVAGGQLAIETINTVLDEEYAKHNPGVVPGEYVLVSVSDTGSGMSKAVQAHLFEPFFTTKEPGKGTGLGLSMVYGFMQRSGGHIKMYSEEGRGTTARMYLPRASGDKSEPSRQVKVEAELPGGTEAVLVVDDEPELLEICQAHLEVLGYRVQVAGNALEALEVLNASAGEIALLFSDVLMPGGMDGYDLAKQVRKQWPSVKILMTSGFTNQAVNPDELSELEEELLHKPYTQRDLAVRVRQILDNGEQRI